MDSNADRARRLDILKQDSATQVLLSSLPDHQLAAALIFLIGIPDEALARFKARLTALSVERFCRLVQQFGAKNSGGLSDGQLLEYLTLFVRNDWTWFTDKNPWGDKGLYALIATEEEASEELKEDYSPSSTQQTISQLARLPTEIYDLIVEKFYEAVFIPGEVQGQSIWFPIDRKVYCSNSNIYKLDFDLMTWRPDLWEKYKPRYWSENTFVFNDGFTEKQRRALWKLLPKYKKVISSIFSIRSIRWVLEYGKPMYWQERTYDHERDLLCNFESFKACCEDHNNYVLGAWLDKAQLFFQLSLSSMVLDFTNAYSLCGEFMGLKFARDTFRFRYGIIPAHFQVIAPSSTLAKGIRRIFEELNS